jgi:ectoine hydroxylase-related dioxygenase (phytanoyl-CoA dioxygenase family)
MSELTADVRLHPWNLSFSWETPRGPFRALTTEQVEQFDREGYVVLDAVFDPAELAAILTVTDEADARTEDMLRNHEDGRFSVAQSGAITFAAHLVAQSQVAREFASHPTLAGVAADLLGPHVNLYWDQAVYKKPEKPRRFPWHQDNGYTFVEPQQYLTCWVALTDATVVNGCPQVVPGLHRLGTLQHDYVDPLGFECFSDPPDAVAAPVNAGGVVVFSSLTPHLTGPNTTDRVRKAYILQYAPTGAVALTGELDELALTRTPCDDPDRQFSVVRAGRRCTPSVLHPVTT